MEFLEEDKQQIEKDDLDEDNSSRELYDFIAAERSSRTSGKSFKGFFEQLIDGHFFAINILAATALDKLFGKFSKDIDRQNGGEYEPHSISSFQKAYSNYLRLPCLSLFAVCLPSKVLQSRFSSHAMLHPSFFFEKHRLNFNLSLIRYQVRSHLG